MDDMPEHVTGTLLIWHIASSVTPMLTTALAAGWALHPTYTPTTVNSVRQNWLYKIATSDSETPPQLDNTGGYVNQTVVSVEDYDTVNIFDVQDKTSNTAVETISLPTPTTTVDECLVIDAFAIYNSAVNLRPYFLKTEVQHLVREVGNRIAIAIGYRVQRTAGALPAATGYCSTSSYYAGTASCITIRNKSGGTLPAYAVQHYTKLLEECRLDSALNTALGVSGVKTYDTITTIGAFAVEDRAFALAVGTPTDTTYKCHHHAYTATVTTGSLWSGQGIQWSTPIDLTNRALCFNWSCSDRARMGTEGCIVVLESSAGNWTAFNLRRQNAILTSAVYTAVIDSTSSVYASAGTTDFSAIVRIHWLYRRTGTTNQSLSVFGLKLIDKEAPCIIVGGGANQPINAERIAFVCNSHDGGNGFTVTGSPIGVGPQLQMRLPVQIGNGTTPTYFNSFGESYFIPKRRFVPARIFDFDVGAGVVGMDIKACSGCTIIDRGTLVRQDAKLHYRILSGSSASASYNFSGKQIFNGTVTWNTDVPATGILFATCDEVDGKAATFTRCTFDMPTVSGSNGALKLDPGGDAIQCIFNAADATDYAVRIPTAGANEVSAFTFSGYTTPIKVTATTGTVTITIAATDVQPAVSTDGATIVWDQAVVGTSWTNEDLVDGTAVLVRNTTTDATIDYEVVSGGNGYTIDMVPGVDYTVGDVIEVRQAYKDGETYYIERTSTIITTSGGGDLVEADPLAVCPICTALGLDGEDYDLVFDLDSTDDELDIITAGTWQTGQLMTWWKWKMTQQAAMEEFWGAWSVQTDGSFRNDVSIMDSLVDTTETGDSIESTGRRIHRSDGARPIKSPTTGGGAIDLSWRDPVTVVATGSGVLPADITAIGAEVATRSQSGELHADVRWVNDVAVTGTGQPGTEWGPA